MKMPKSIGLVHFIGIGGIGMSGIAEVLHNLGHKVQGSDQADSANVQRLRAKGIETAVDVYAGSPKKAMQSHTLNGDVHLIMTRAGIGDWIARIFDGTTSVFKWFKRPSFSPVMLINPRTLV